MNELDTFWLLLGGSDMEARAQRFIQEQKQEIERLTELQRSFARMMSPEPSVVRCACCCDDAPLLPVQPTRPIGFLSK